MRAGTLRATLIAAGCLVAMAGMARANLLINGDFNTDADGAWGPDGWTSWSWNGTGGSDYADYVTSPTATYTKDGSPYINAGNSGSWFQGGAGWYQLVPVTPGLSYTITVDSSTEDWATDSNDSPAGEIRLIYFQADRTTEIRRDLQSVANYEAGKAWQPYTETSIAPAGAAVMKVELATWGARGTVNFDNAILTVPEPASIGTMLGVGLLAIGRRRVRKA